MKARFTLSALLTACIALSSVRTLVAQENKYPDAKPMFVAGRAHRDIAVRKSPAGNIVQWNGGFTDITKKKITFTMIGTDPTKTNTSTTIPVPSELPKQRRFTAGIASRTTSERSAPVSRTIAVLF